jgi:hypothetical protein
MQFFEDVLLLGAEPKYDASIGTEFAYLDTNLQIKTYQIPPDRTHFIAPLMIIPADKKSDLRYAIVSKLPGAKTFVTVSGEGGRIGMFAIR